MKQIVWVCVLAFACGALAQVGDSQNVWLVVKGFFEGLRIAKVAPSIGQCWNAIRHMVKSFDEAMEAYKENQTPYNFLNNATYAIGTISPVFRVCAGVPDDAWKNIEEKYMKKFDYSWQKYFHAVFLNLGLNMDVIIFHVIKAVRCFEEKNFLCGGQHCGRTANTIFNVTSLKPVPPPPPIDEVAEAEIVDSKGMNWTKLHHSFRLYYNISMITLNYTKWINHTTADNLNSSVMNMEMKLYTAIVELTKPAPRDVLEGILCLTDIFQYLNPLFNGIYFTIKQVPEKIFKDSIFEYILYAPLNWLQHLGYFIWDGYKLYTDWGVKGRENDLYRRITVIIRKILYFDDDVLDDIRHRTGFHGI